jgi:hypothetical protein
MGTRARARTHARTQQGEPGHKGASRSFDDGGPADPRGDETRPRTSGVFVVGPIALSSSHRVPDGPALTNGQAPRSASPPGLPHVLLGHLLAGGTASSTSSCSSGAAAAAAAAAAASTALASPRMAVLVVQPAGADCTRGDTRLTPESAISPDPRARVPVDRVCERGRSETEIM